MRNADPSGQPSDGGADHQSNSQSRQGSRAELSTKRKVSGGLRRIAAARRLLAVREEQGHDGRCQELRSPARRAENAGQDEADREASGPCGVQRFLEDIAGLRSDCDDGNLERVDERRAD